MLTIAVSSGSWRIPCKWCSAKRGEQNPATSFLCGFSRAFWLHHCRCWLSFTRWTSVTPGPTQSMSPIKWFCPSSDCVFHKIFWSGELLFCDGSSGRSLGLSLVLASFPAGIRAELRGVVGVKPKHRVMQGRGGGWKGTCGSHLVQHLLKWAHLCRLPRTMPWQILGTY